MTYTPSELFTNKMVTTHIEGASTMTYTPSELLLTKWLTLAATGLTPQA
jgi:hypothetical protein